MGGGASSNFSFFRTADPAAMVRQMRTDIEMVECFVVNVYASFPRTESMWLILGSKMGQKSFQTFCRAELVEEYLTLFLDIAEFLAQNQSYDDDLIVTRFDSISAKLFDQDTDISGLINQGLRSDIHTMSNASPVDKDLGTDRMVSMLSRLQTELVYIMSRDLFNRFILSKHYKTWRAAESSHAMATTFEDATIMSSDSSFNFQSSSRKSSTKSLSTKHRHRLRSVVAPSDMVISALSAVENTELQHVLHYSETWLTALLAAVEALPISFTLASAKTTRKGFPLIYVNQYFEKTTGYARERVLGKNCKDVLQCPETEPQGKAVMSKCLRSKTPCVVVLTNATKEGRRFRNLVALKPVLNARGDYVYVIGLQIDISREREGEEIDSKLSLAQELLDMIPSRIAVDPAEEDEMDSEYGSGKSVISVVSEKITPCLPFSLKM